MHTAICTFDDRATAEQAVQRLVQAGFDRDDVHIQHRHADGSLMTEDPISGRGFNAQRYRYQCEQCTADGTKGGWEWTHARG